MTEMSAGVGIAGETAARAAAGLTSGAGVLATVSMDFFLGFLRLPQTPAGKASCVCSDCRRCNSPIGYGWGLPDGGGVAGVPARYALRERLALRTSWSVARTRLGGQRPNSTLKPAP